MGLHPNAGLPAPKNILTNIPKLIAEYYTIKPDVENIDNFVVFGTSGHRGTSKNGSFNEEHIASITQAICTYRKNNGITGPLFIGKDTHALSEPAFITAVEVLTANEVTIMVSANSPYTPTPVISHAILTYNKNRTEGLSDGIVITPSHNPPEDGGFKYNPPHGGPADTDVTVWLEKEANRLIAEKLTGVRRLNIAKTDSSGYVKKYDYMASYISDLKNVVNMDIIASSGIKIAADALGGSGLDYIGAIADMYKINIDTFNTFPDPTFSFMSVDKDGKIRMDCSSPYAMAGLINLKDKYDIAFGNDPDYDRHGIVTKGGGLMNPNHYLSVAIKYLFSSRKLWNPNAVIGKTLVSSSMIDRVGSMIGRKVAEVPVGFKWFVNGLLDGSYGFGGEESAGASFLRMDGTVWSTDKDGIIMGLLAGEILSATEKDPYQHYTELEDKFGKAVYTRIDAPADTVTRNKIKKLSPSDITADKMAGEAILEKLSSASGNGAAIGGVKVVTKNGWFAARPSGTENIYKIYAESFIDDKHLKMIIEEAQQIISECTK